MTFRFPLWRIASIGLLLVGAGSLSASPRPLVESELAQALTVLRNPELPVADKSSRVTQIVEQRLDFDILSRLSLGPRFNELTESQRNEFQAEFRKHVLAIASLGVEQYRGQDIVIREERQESRGDWIVETRVIGIKNGTPREVAKIDFRLRQREGKWSVIDLTIGGISMAGGFRAQFDAILKTQPFDRLLQMLKDKNAARK